LKKLSPTEPRGNQARHLTTLAMMISGIVGSKQVHLGAIAGKVPTVAKVESRIKRFSRFLCNQRINFDGYYLPYAKQLLANLAHQPLIFIMDGSPVGRGCRTLMLCVNYKNRALPLAWLVAEGNRGHFSQENHLLLVKQVQGIVPKDVSVVFLGDGEFDGTQLQAKIDSYGWKYVCRTAKDLLLTDDWMTFTFEQLQVCPGERITLSKVSITQKQYGPVQAIAFWDADYEEPLYLISNLSIYDNPCDWYSKRFVIETFFSDQKSRGFHLHKSHISSPQRLEQLMIGACLAYIWIVYLGTFVIQYGWVGIIHRTDRCDLSLFQLGIRFLEYCLNEDIKIPTQFHRME